MENIFVIDIGNTNTVCGLYSDGDLVNSFRLSSDRDRTTDEYYVLFKSLNSEHKIDYIAVSSVVPIIGRTIESVILRYYNVPYIFVNGNTPLGIKYNMSDASFIGADLVVNAYAAWQKYQTNCIICDLGTATTIQLIGEDGSFYGTSIMPGLTTAAYNLFEKAALLTKIQLEAPVDLLGLNTKDALLTGIIRGHAYSIDGFVKRIKEQFNKLGSFTTIATGGISNLVAEQSENIDVIDKTLTLDGLYFISIKLLVTSSNS